MTDTANLYNEKSPGFNETIWTLHSNKYLVNHLLYSTRQIFSNWPNVIETASLTPLKSTKNTNGLNVDKMILGQLATTTCYVVFELYSQREAQIEHGYQI